MVHKIKKTLVLNKLKMLEHRCFHIKNDYSDKTKSLLTNIYEEFYAGKEIFNFREYLGDSNFYEMQQIKGHQQNER